MKNRLLFSLGCLLLTISAMAQDIRVSYTQPEKDDSRRTNFEVIGKMGTNFVAYKNNRTEHAICVYDNEMKLVNRTTMDFIESNRFLNVDFIAYADFFYAIYQYQRRNVVYCNVVKLDGMGKKVGEPVELDSTHIHGGASAEKVYTTIFSDDKQKIMLLKINSQNLKNYVFTMLLYDNNMQLKDKSKASLGMEERNNYFTDFYLSNNSELVFCKFIRSNNSNESVSDVTMITKYADSLDFALRPVDIGNKILDELRLKIDNSKRKTVLSSFYYKQKRGSVEGLYVLSWDIAKDEKLHEKSFEFNEELRAAAKGEDGSKKSAFDDYYVKNAIVRKDGGYLLIAESLYSSSRGNNYNRWNNPYWGSPWSSPMDYYYYPNYNSPYYMPWNRGGYNNYQDTRFFAENIMVLSFSPDGDIEWNNIIPKNQYDDASDNTLSYGLMNTGGELHFLFNQYERRTLILNDQSIGPDGKIMRHPTLKNLDRGYEFMPRFSKQVSNRQMIIPCWYKNYLCFAKVDF